MTHARNLARLARTGMPTVMTAQDLRDLAIYSNEFPIVAKTFGAKVEGDVGGGEWRWVPTSTKTDDLGTVLTPTGHAGPGRWERPLTGSIHTHWFGATGDGVTNDTAAIQAAITAAEDLGGNIPVILVGGQTYIVGTLTISVNGIVLTGTGKYATLKFTPGGDDLSCVYFENASDTSGILGAGVRNVWFVSSDATYKKTAAQFVNGNRCLFDGCRIGGGGAANWNNTSDTCVGVHVRGRQFMYVTDSMISANHCVKMSSGTVNNNIDWMTVSNCSFQANYATTQGQGAGLVVDDDVYATNCTFEDLSINVLNRVFDWNTTTAPQRSHNILLKNIRPEQMTGNQYVYTLNCNYPGKSIRMELCRSGASRSIETNQDLSLVQCEMGSSTSENVINVTGLCDIELQQTNLIGKAALPTGMAVSDEFVRNIGVGTSQLPVTGFIRNVGVDFPAGTVTTFYRPQTFGVPNFTLTFAITSGGFQDVLANQANNGRGSLVDVVAYATDGSGDMIAGQVTIRKSEGLDTGTIIASTGALSVTGGDPGQVVVYRPAGILATTMLRVENNTTEEVVVALRILELGLTAPNYS